MVQPSTPTAAWAELWQGNLRFVDGRSEHPNQDVGRREQTAAKQTPFAVVFGCMDSRVAAEIIFDRGIGDLAVVRTAGHVVDSGVLGSLEFGVAVLGIPLVVVLGHDHCGAIEAALTAHSTRQMPTGYLRDIVERITSSLVTSRREGDAMESTDPDEVSDEHVRNTVRFIVERSARIGAAVQDGSCAVVGVGYRLAEGRVRMIEAVGSIGDASAATVAD